MSAINLFIGSWITAAIIPGFQRAVAWCESHGKEVVRLPRTAGICSSDIKKNLLQKGERK